MTEQTLSQLTYVGPHRRVSVGLPTRVVDAVRGGDPVEFTADELDHLDPNDWAGERHAPASGKGQREAAGPADGQPAQVLKRVAGDPVKAREALDAELAKDRPRKKLVTALEAIAAPPTVPADSATTSADPAANPEG